MIYWIAHIFWVVVSKIFFPCRVHGLKNLPSNGGFILASNHLSNLDPMIIGISSRRRLSYMAKDSLFKGKFFTFILHQVGAFPVKRGTSDIGALKTAIKRLKAGCPLVVFPEGTRKKGTAEPQEVHSGIGFLALKSEAPVVPVFIHGSDRVLPPGAKFPKRFPLEVTFGKPQIYRNQTAYTTISGEILQEIRRIAK